jgi:hypothetical protein
MRRLWLFIAIAAILLVSNDRATAEGNEVLPQPVDPAEFAMLWTNSPFARNVTPNASASEAAEYSLTGIVEIGSSQYVTVLNRKTNDRQMIGSGDDDENNRVVTINFASDPEKASATVIVNGKKYVVRYDPQLLAAAPAPPVPVTRAKPGAKKTTRRTVRPTTAGQGQPTPPGTSRVLRRRIIVPPSNRNPNQ